MPLLAAIVLFSFGIGALAGFGNVVLALTMGSLFFAVEELLPVLVGLSFLLTLYLAVRYPAQVAWPLLWRSVLPWMGVGTLVGLLVLDRAPDTTLKTTLGVFVLFLAARELFPIARRPESRRTPAVGSARWWFLGAGVTHGVFASGGPLLVYALGRQRLSPGSFRATLALVWLVLDGLLLVGYGRMGRLDGVALHRILFLLPVLAVAIALGEWAHRRVNAAAFRKLVYTLLLLAGTCLVAG